MNAPRHPLEAQLAQRLLPYVSPYSALDRWHLATTIARTLLEMWERQHARELDEVGP
jgi:hypothetical protein